MKNTDPGDVAEQAEASPGHFDPMTVTRRKERFDSNLPGLLEEVLNNPTCSALKIPINLTRGILAELAQVAIEIDDDRLHVMMLRLGLYDVKFDKRVEMIREIEDRLFKKAMEYVTEYNRRKGKNE